MKAYGRTLTLTIVLMAVFWGFSTATYAQRMVTIPEDAYKAILERLDTLQKRVDKLERERTDTSSLKKDIDDIYDTLDKVETKTIKDKLNIGAEVRTRVDNFYYRGTYFNPFTGRYDKYIKDHKDNHWTSRFRLNLDAKITRELMFHGRLSVTKNWADNDPENFYTDFNRGHAAGGNTNVQFERAYIDWIVPNSPVPLAITFGRHPSTEGPPVEFKENRQRQSTYPALLFDGEADGIVATIGLERYTGLKNSGLRFAYGKGFQDDDDYENYLDTRSGLDDTNFMALFFESEIPTLPRSLMVLSYIRAFDMVDNPLGPNKNVGDMDLYGIHLQAKDIEGTGLDAFLSWGLNYSHPGGTTMFNTPMGPAPVGLLTNDGKDNKTGWAIYAGLRYTMPLQMLNNPKIGFEYNHGSQYWFTFTQSSIEFYNKLATRGDVYDIYYIQPFNRYLFARIGYTYIDYDYSNSGMHLGKPMDQDDILTDFYILLDCRF